MLLLHLIMEFAYHRPNATGRELIELGGIVPTSVTTAVMFDGGVRSYKGFRIWRFSSSHNANRSRLCDVGNEESRAGK